jgi:hypothetical protein
MADILARTPVWVFPLFLALLYFGYSQSKTTQRRAPRIAAVPAAMLGLSLYGLGSAFGADWRAFAFWMLGLALAALLNMLLQQPKGVAYSRETRAYTIPGSWLPLGLIMGIFFIRYSVTAALATNPSLASAGALSAAVGLVYGLLSGLLFSRAIQALRVKNG